MKIQLVTDTHGYNYIQINPEADLIIHAGDAGNGIQDLLEFSFLVKAEQKPLLVVPGNHDLWHQDLNDLKELFKSLDINFLDSETVYEQDGFTFVGGTLFSNFRQNVVEPWEHDKIKENFSQFTDFRCIALDGKAVTPSDYVTLFNKTLNNINQYRGKDNVVVVTHFPPSPECSHPIYPREDLPSGYFTNNIDITGFKLWLFGHTHFNMDQTIQGCRVVSNAYGYPGELLGNDYNPSLLIEV